MNNINRGIFVVFEGTDRCGKSTQSKLLKDYFISEGKGAVLMNFPNRKTDIGKLIDDYLSKKKGNIDKKYLHKLFSTNRWEAHKLIKNMLLVNKNNIVCDRYCYSGLAYSMSNGLSEDWCKLSDSGLIKPDIVFYLSNDITNCSNREGFGEEIYEKTDFQTKVKYNFENFIINKEDNIIKINCENKNIEQIHNEIINIIKEYKFKTGVDKIWQ